MKTKLFFLAWLMLTLGKWVNPALGQSRFSMSVNVAPLYGHSAFNAVLPISTDPAFSTTSIASRSHTIGYSFGLMGHYGFSAKWSVSTGIWATSILSTKGDFSVNDDNSTISIHNPHPFQYGYRIPVLVNYRWTDKRVSPYFSVGTSANFRSTSYIYLNGQEVPIKEGKAIRKGPLMVGAGAIFQVRERTSLVVQPMLEYSLNAKPDNYDYSRSYSLSVQAQFRYQF